MKTKYSFILWLLNFNHSFEKYLSIFWSSSFMVSCFQFKSLIKQFGLVYLVCNIEPTLSFSRFLPSCPAIVSTFIISHVDYNFSQFLGL
jgi:hypothetical protein